MTRLEIYDEPSHPTIKLKDVNSGDFVKRVEYYYMRTSIQGDEGTFLCVQFPGRTAHYISGELEVVVIPKVRLSIHWS
jgi:hypothetical protein